MSKATGNIVCHTKNIMKGVVKEAIKGVTVVMEVVARCKTRARCTVKSTARAGHTTEHIVAYKENL